MTGSPLMLPLLSVNVGLPAPLGLHRGETVMSAIRKRPVDADAILLAESNLEGDRQADLSVHGGPDKAVYAYSAVHWPDWQSEHGLAAGPGSFGENLTLGEARESEIRVGDVFAWGDALIAVSQPRQPCFKLALLLGRADIGAAMVRSGRSGFYLRVLRGAVVPVRGTSLRRVETRAQAPSVLDLFMAMHDRHATAEALAGYAAAPGLSADWRRAFETRAAARRTG